MQKKGQAAGKGKGKKKEIAGREIVPVSIHHKALAEFQGTWEISQRFFTSADAKPMLSRGRAQATIYLDGRASFMHSKLENGYEALVLTTFNPTTCQFEGVFMDIHSFDGLDPLLGLPVTGVPEAADSKYDLSDRAVEGEVARRRVWSSRLTVPRFTSLVEGAPELLAGVDEVPVQIVEHQISQDEWLLLCVSEDAVSGEQFVQMENTYTRA